MRGAPDRRCAAAAAVFIATASCLPAVPEPPLPHTKGAEYRYVTVGQARIAYVDVGEGEPLLFLHGFVGEIWNWKHQIREFAPDHRVVAVDLVGWGYSEKPHIDYTPEAYIEFLDSFMEAIGLRSATLVGSSMGAAVAWGCAIVHPARVQRLVLIGSVSPRVVDELENLVFRHIRAFRHWPVISDLIIEFLPRPISKHLLKEFVYDDGLADAETFSLFRRRMMAPGMRHVMLSTARKMDEWRSYETKLQTITAPTLVVWGLEDEVFSPLVGARLHEAIPGSRFAVVEKSGHLPMWETPEVVNTLIRSFLLDTSGVEPHSE